MILWAGGPVDVVAGGSYPAWCDRCMSSSAVRIRFYILAGDGPRPVGLWFACQVCDPHRFDDGEAGPDGDEVVGV